MLEVRGRERRTTSVRFGVVWARADVDWIWQGLLLRIYCTKLVSFSKRTGKQLDAIYTWFNKSQSDHQAY